MDHPDHPVEQPEIAAPKTSVAKVAALVDELQRRQADDPELAGQLALMGGILPFLLPMLPQDPFELDGLLLIGAKWALNLRSDEAWQPEHLDELYGLGADQ